MTYADKPWLRSYKLGPYKLKHSLEPYPEVPVYKCLDDTAGKYPGQTAILFQGRTLKYKELKTQADKLATALMDFGVRRGDRVCIFLPNCPEFIISDWAVLKAGGAVVPTSIMRTDEGLLHEVGTSKSRVIICREEHLDRVIAVKEKSDLEHIIVTSTDGYDVTELKLGTLPGGTHEFRKIISEYEASPPGVKIQPKEDLCEVAFTGGATGVPKGVMITHFNRYTNIMQSIPWLLAPLAPGIIGKASVFITVPLFHAYGHWMEQMAAYWGLRIILAPDPRDNDEIVRIMKEYRPFLIPTVPTQLMRMAKGKVGRMNVLCMSAAAPLPLEVANAIKNEIGNPVAEGYGLTEAGPITHMNPSAFSKITGFMPQVKHSFGVPLPDTECKIVDPEGREVPIGEEGELMVRGPQIMKGYWPEPGQGLTEDGWLHTGDIARMDEEGYFYIQDRTKDMINVSGFKVYTITVDEVLFKHPGVLMAGAIGIPDPNMPGNERVMAIIKPRDEYKGKITEEEIIEICKKHLPPYAVPKHVQFRDELPLTVTEKLWKKKLREEVIEEMKQEGNI
ncbi:MAG TPA: hypothetical protein ENG51_15205 [Deltaproteobacteria bacterium]|nr:hypothetical protein [Deltaproteobacteria bacterium]